MKKHLVILLFIILISTSSCGLGSDEETWYRINCDENLMNVVTITNKTDEGFDLKADCINAAHSGTLEEHFTFESDTVAIYNGESIAGDSYSVIIYLSDNMRIEVDPKGCDKGEYFLLSFGAGVWLSGEYSTEKPVFDYSDLMTEKVFHYDEQLEASVKAFLGEDKFHDFSRAFGFSNYISETQNDGHIVTKGFVRGISYTCFFSADTNGYFYGIYNDQYFSNDPIYRDNPPVFLTKNK